MAGGVEDLPNAFDPARPRHCRWPASTKIRSSLPGARQRQKLPEGVAFVGSS